jgi:hypothetical protein
MANDEPLYAVLVSATGAIRKPDVVKLMQAVFQAGPSLSNEVYKALSKKNDVIVAKLPLPLAEQKASEFNSLGLSPCNLKAELQALGLSR